MDKFANKVAVVTGSSSGIGSAISTELVKHGVIVVGIARRLDKLKVITIWYLHTHVMYLPVLTCYLHF